jgi:hypothetical protein
MLNPVIFFREFRIRAYRIKENQGTTGLVRGILGFISYPFYKSTRYYLYEIPPLLDYSKLESNPRIADKKLSFKVVRSNIEADELESEGFSFRSQVNEFNYYLKLYTRWLDCGAIAFCTFVDKEFATISWVLPSQHAQDAVKAPPAKIDYANHEVMQRGMWVNPKYRGMGLYRHTVYYRDSYLVDNGVKMLRATVDFTNKIGKGVDEALGSTQYGTARALRIMWFKSWKEYHY